VSPMDRRDYSPEWPAISRAIKRRAKGACELCPAEERKPHWKTGSIVVLTGHHVNGDRRDDRPANLLALCQRCHHKLERTYRDKRWRGGQKELPL